MGSPSKKYNISPVLTIETIGNSVYQCNYKSHKIEYNEMKLNETRVHSIYENLNKIKYQIFKFWFYNHRMMKDRFKLEMSMDLLEQLHDKDFYDMSQADKIMLTILYHELMKLKNNNI